MTDQIISKEEKKEEFVLNEMRPCIALRLRKNRLVRIDHGVNPDTGKNIISYVFEVSAKKDYDEWITGSEEGIYGPLREVFKAMDEWKQAIRSIPRK